LVAWFVFRLWVAPRRQLKPIVGGVALDHA